MASTPSPLFKHPRLIAAAMLVVLAAVSGTALYVRPLSGELSPVTRSGRGEPMAMVSTAMLGHAAFPAALGVRPPLG